MVSVRCFVHAQHLEFKRRHFGATECYLLCVVWQEIRILFTIKICKKSNVLMFSQSGKSDCSPALGESQGF